jgi:serine/threonine-protein kinase
VLEFGDGEFVIVMDLLNGESLSQLLERRGALSLGETATLLVPALRALRAAHTAGIVHRDLKPDNLFLDRPSGDEMQPKLLDFGIAKLVGTEGPGEQSLQLTQTGTLMGTPFYMSPEQVYGERDVDQRGDVWAVGVIAYECLCGTRPFQGENFGQLFKAVTRGEYRPLPELAPHVPPHVVAVIDRMLSVDREGRPRDVEPLLDVLLPYNTGQTPSLSPTGPVKVVTPFETDETLVASELSQSLPRSRVPVLAWVFGGAGVLATAVGGYWWATQPSDAAPAANLIDSAAPSATSSAATTALASPEPTRAGATPVHAAPSGPVVTPSAVPSASTARPEQHSRPTRPRSPAQSEPVASSAPLKPATPTPAQTRLPGSIVGDAPF